MLSERMLHTHTFGDTPTACTLQYPYMFNVLCVSMYVHIPRMFLRLPLRCVLTPVKCDV